MKRLKTNRVFYKKWTYKIHCNRVKLAGSYLSDQGYLLRNQSSLKFNIALDKFRHEDMQLRHEGNYTSIFCNDPLLVEKLILTLSDFVLQVYEPASKAELDFFKNNSANKIICDRYPYDLYRYRINLIYQIDVDTKQKFLNWAEKQGLEKIRISNATSRWLSDTIYWTQTPFMYVSNSQVLSMVCLYLGNNIKKVEEFVLRSSINSE